MATDTRLLQLPIEVRLKIYKNVLESYRIVTDRDEYTSAGSTQQKLYLYRLHSPDDPTNRCVPLHPLSYVCKQIYNELSEPVYKLGVFSIRLEYSGIQNFYPAPVFPQYLGSKIHAITLDTIHHLNLFTTIFPSIFAPESQKIHLATKAHFKELPNLKALRVKWVLVTNIMSHCTRTGHGGQIKRLVLLRKDFDVVVDVELRTQPHEGSVLVGTVTIEGTELKFQHGHVQRERPGIDKESAEKLLREAFFLSTREDVVSTKEDKVSTKKQRVSMPRCLLQWERAWESRNPNHRIFHVKRGDYERVSRYIAEDRREIFKEDWERHFSQSDVL